MTPEALARICIDQGLQAAGWQVHDLKQANIQLATGSGKTFTAISFIYRLIKFAPSMYKHFPAVVVHRDELVAMGVPAPQQGRYLSKNVCSRAKPCIQQVFWVQTLMTCR
jgi:hypothetical protein